MEEILLRTNGGDCHIHIGNNILDNVGALISDKLPGKKISIITNPTVNSIYGERVLKNLEVAGFDCTIIEIPDSESSKSLEWANFCYSELTRNGLDRSSCIIGLGGGVVGDLAGFVAATFMRGICLVQIPTTLLGQIDSAIGGKTGLNLPEGKNLVGAFHQPGIVISDVNVLKTLPERDFVSGLAEMVKYGIVSDAELFEQLENNVDHIMSRDPKILEKIVTGCSEIKARIVEKDELDHAERQMLNYGHTLGHALETASDYDYSHGEAVAIGMIFAARLSVKFNILSKNELDIIMSLILKMGLPVSLKNAPSSDMLVHLMCSDKKSVGGKNRFILPASIGETVIVDDINHEVILSTLEEMRT